MQENFLNGNKVIAANNHENNDLEVSMFYKNFLSLITFNL